jgi:hypothetical protein
MEQFGAREAEQHDAPPRDLEHLEAASTQACCRYGATEAAHHATGRADGIVGGRSSSPSTAGH